MKNRASSHLLIILLILGLEIAGYWGIHRAALLRGYETSIVGAKTRPLTGCRRDCAARPTNTVAARSAARRPAKAR